VWIYPIVPHKQIGGKLLTQGTFQVTFPSQKRILGLSEKAPQRKEVRIWGSVNVALDS
jgi:hypothetical protein